MTTLTILPKLESALNEKDTENIWRETISSFFSENNIKQALDLTVRLKYLTNLVNNIKLKIKNADN